MSLYTDLLADPKARRNFLVEIEPYDLSTEATTTLRYSTNGFKTVASDTPPSTLYEERMMSEFRVKKSIYKRDRIGGGSDSSYGSITLVNTDGALDSWPDEYSFSGRTVTIRMAGDVGFTIDSDGDSSYDSATDAGVRFTGIIDGEPTIGLDSVSLRVTDIRKQMVAETIAPAYHGSRRGLRLVNSSWADGGVISELDITGDMAVLIRVNPDSLGDYHLFGWGHSAATRLPWHLQTRADGNIRLLYTHSGGTAATAYSTSGNMYTVGTMKCIGFRISGDKAWLFSQNLDDRNEPISWDGPLTNSNLENRDLNVAGTVRVGDDTSGVGFVGYVSEARVYDGPMLSYADGSFKRSIEQRIWTSKIASSDAVDVTGLEGYWKFIETSGTNVNDYSSNNNDLTISGIGSVWDYPLGGWDDISGMNRPTAIGEVSRCKATMIDPSKLIYQWHHRSVSGLTRLTENGGAVDPDHITSPATWTDGGNIKAGGPHLNNAPDLDTFIGTSPAGGTHTVYNALGLFRIGSSPSGTMLVDGKGDADGGYVDDQGEVLERYLSDFTEVDASRLDLSSYIDETRGNICGVFIETGSTIKQTDVVDLIVAPSGYWDQGRSSGKINAGVFREPDGTTGTVHELTEADIEKIKPKALTPPIQGQRIGYDRSQSVLNTEAIFAAAANYQIDLYSKEYRWVTFIEGTIAIEYLQSGDIIDVPTAFADSDVAFSEGVLRQDLYGQPRRLWVVTLLSEPDTMELNDQVGITWNGPNPRLGLETTRYFRLVEFDEKSNTITVWG